MKLDYKDNQPWDSRESSIYTVNIFNENQFKSGFKFGLLSDASKCNNHRMNCKAHNEVCGIIIRMISHGWRG